MRQCSIELRIVGAWAVARIEWCVVYGDASSRRRGHEQAADRATLRLPIGSSCRPIACASRVPPVSRRAVPVWRLKRGKQLLSRLRMPLRASERWKAAASRCGGRGARGANQQSVSGNDNHSDNHNANANDSDIDDEPAFAYPPRSCPGPS
jgi:hypothetical protein